MKNKWLSWLCLLTTISSLVGAGSGCNAKAKWFMSPTAEYTETEKETPLPVYSRTYEWLGGSDVMPIGTYSGPATERTIDGKKVESFLTDEKFELFKECGINFFASTVDGAQDWNNMQLLLELSEKHGFGVFATDSGIRGASQGLTMTTERLNQRVQKYLQYDSFLGAELLDEPSVSIMDALGNTMESWKNSSLLTGKDMYYNALPDYSTGTQLSGTDTPISYEEYVRKYIEILGANYFSYDYYPFQNWGVLSPTYYDNLSVARNLSEEYKIPFWTFIQCGGDWGYGWTECVPETDGAFLWNVNTCLAYGAKGIQYFTLNQYPGFLSTNDPLSATRSGMFGAFGNINRWYYFAKKANKWIQAIDHILMNSTNTGVIFHGKSPTKASTGAEVIKDGKYRQMTSVQGDDALVGCFDYYGSTMLMVVNNSTKKDNAKITLTFDGVYGYEIYQRDSMVELAGNALQFKLDVGEATLVILK